MPIKLDVRVEQAFAQVVPPVLVFLLDVLSHLHPEINIEGVVVENRGTSVAVIYNSVESVVSQLSPEHQSELQNLAKAFGQRLLEKIDTMMWEPKLQDGKIVGFSRRIRRCPR